MADRKAARAKGEETRRRNAEIRARAEAERRERESQDRALVCDVMRDIMRDSGATIAQRLYAASVLEYLQYYHFTPYGVKPPIEQGSNDMDAITEELREKIACMSKE